MLVSRLRRLVEIGMAMATYCPRVVSVNVRSTDRFG